MKNNKKNTNKRHRNVSAAGVDIAIAQLGMSITNMSPDDRESTAASDSRTVLHRSKKSTQ